MYNKWIKYPDLKCVVLCAGRGKRMFPASVNTPKVLNTAGGYPILYHVVNYWRLYTQDFIFVVNYQKDSVIKFVRDLPVNSVCVEQRELRGIADALTYAFPYIKDNFILVLGDCLCNGKFFFPKDMEQGVAIWKTEDSEAIKRSYSAELTVNRFLSSVVEKPKYLPNKWCGLGYYFFNKQVFDYIRITPPSQLRGEVEITDVIQNMINAGEDISAVEYQGDYINATYPEDLKKVESIVLQDYESFSV